jgi:hypothetical protein
LQKFFPGIEAIAAKGNTLQEILEEVETKCPNIQNYLLDDQGKLRNYVNIFIDGNVIIDCAGPNYLVQKKSADLIFHPQKFDYRSMLR